ncbi:MAG: hypothetical protein R2705_13460 [Ilumatobacteraceae bacterium]
MIEYRFSSTMTCEPAAERYWISSRAAFFVGQVAARLVESGLDPLLHLSVLGGTLPRRVEEPEMIEEVLLECALLGIGIDQSVEALDDLGACSCDFEIERSFDVIQLRKDWQEGLHVLFADMVSSSRRPERLSRSKARMPCL